MDLSEWVKWFNSHPEFCAYHPRLVPDVRAGTARIEALEAENARLRGIIEDTPICIIDLRAAELKGEKELIAYFHNMLEWHKRASAAIGLETEGGSDVRTG